MGSPLPEAASDRPALKPSPLRRGAGLDVHIFVTLLFRGWSVVAGALTLLLLPLGLNAVEQGYYYTFGGVLALQIFFELGLNQIIMQLVSHEVAHLQFDNAGHLAGDAARLGRLSSLARLVKRWYAWSAIGFFVICAAVGAVFFRSKGTLPMSHWMGVWLVLVLATSVNLMLSPRLAMLEGCGKVGSVARLRLAQSIAGYLCLWSVLLGGGGLWAVMLLPLVAAAYTTFWLRSQGDILRWLVYREVDGTAPIQWSKDVLPLQWRIAVSWMSGFFIVNIITPFVFAHRGAVEAGQYGMALNVFSAVSSVGMSWVFAKAPAFTMLISRGERRELNTLFRSVALRSSLATTVLSMAVVAGAWLLGHAGVHAISRLAPLPVLFCLAVITSANSVHFAFAVYMRAHREEPLLALSVVTGVVTVIAVYFGSRVNLFAMASLQAAVVVLVPLPWSAVLFRRYYRRAS